MAGNDELISDIIDVGRVNKQIIDATNYLENLDELIVKTAKDAVTLNTNLGGAKSFADYSAKANAAAIGTERLSAAQNKAAITSKNLEIANIRLEAAQARQAAAQQKAADQAQKQLSPYNQLSKELDKLRASAKDVGVQFGLNSKQFTDAQKPVLELDKRLKDIDKALGQNQRNVGNYEHDVSNALNNFASLFDRIIPGAGTFSRTIVQGFAAIPKSVNSVVGSINAFTTGGFGFKPQTETKEVDTATTITNTAAETANTAATEANTAAKTAQAGATEAATEAEVAQSTALADTTAKTGFLSAGFASLATIGVAIFVAGISSAIYYLSQFQDTANKVDIYLAGLKTKYGALGKEIVENPGNVASSIAKKFLPLGFNAIAQAADKNDKDSLDSKLDDAQKAGEEMERLAIAVRNSTDITTTKNARLQAEADNLRTLASNRKTDIADRNKYLKQAEDIENQILNNTKKNSDLTIQSAIASSNIFKKLNQADIAELKSGNIQRANELLNAGKITKSGYTLLVQAYAQQTQAIQQATSNRLKIQTDADNMGQRADRSRAQAQDRLDKARLEGANDVAKLTLDNDKASYDDKIKANQTFINNSIKLARIERQNQLEAAGIGGRGGTDSQTQAITRLAIEQEYQNKRNSIIAQGEKQTQAIEKATSEELKTQLENILKGDQDRANASVQVLTDANTEALQQIQETRDKEAQLTEQRYADGKISEQTYRNQLLQIEDAYNVKRLQKQLDTDKAILAIREAEYNNALNDVQGNESQVPDTVRTALKSAKGAVQTDTTNLGNAKNKQSIDNTNIGKQLTDNQRDAIQAIQDAQQLEQDGLTLINAGYQKQIQLLEERKQLIQDTANQEIQQIQNSVASEKTKQIQINVINAQTAAANKQIAAEEQKIKERQAKYDRALAIANIIENTAVGATKATGTIFGISLVPIIIALGAAELATVLATPLPSYRYGTTDHPGGAFIWGEAGVEMAIEPDGKRYFSPDEATLATAPKGTQIVPSFDLMHMIAPYKAIYPDVTVFDTLRMEQLIGETNRLLKNKPKVSGFKPGSAAADIFERRMKR